MFTSINLCLFTFTFGCVKIGGACIPNSQRCRSPDNPNNPGATTCPVYGKVCLVKGARCNVNEDGCCHGTDCKDWLNSNRV
ncbi:hypothetical protein Mgra_00010100 [Meloidogyne graminicola]|uniref:CC domain-containing protein n=1 Tax=Meloidogyne graminicola TaxID=189291 RepID=A0A8S9ZA83_9BILA|nr:hypothetical protein Mgra_00010100 [Meloidogyne graminicola]